tara:strand:+ start:554 stop:2284 length:1731 start_codon:yes stop_codon:yes gene_type:complete
LGINAYHGDASACLFNNADLVTAVEEERFSRVKHSGGFPAKAINYCLTNSNIEITDIDHIAINRNPKTRFLSKLIYLIKNKIKIKNIKNRAVNLKKITQIKNDFESIFKKKVKAKIHFIDHHLSHAAGAVLFSKFENCNYITVDGFGDFVSTTTGVYKNGKFLNIDEVLYPHSLGLFYTAITQYLGFKNYGDEYKVMGLAPYGKPIFCEEMKKIINLEKKKLFSLNLDYFVHHTDGVEMTWLDKNVNIGNVYSGKLNDLFGPAREKGQNIEQKHKDIAASAQKTYENIFLDIINNLYHKNKCINLSISGGCGMNSVANGKILENTDYKNVYVQSNPGDGGGSVGAAAYTIKKIIKNVKFENDTPFLGPSFSSSEVNKTIQKNQTFLDKENIEVNFYNEEEKLIEILSKYISNGLIIGLFRGKMEFGPRALGNRSIIADPREKNIREILNLKIKRRESFRPFAPSILENEVVNWFEFDDDSPFMSKVYKIKSDKRKIIPAVTHVDGTGRIQTVSSSTNNFYYQLIQKFNDITNVPMLLNTSFNENEPIVCNPEQAMDCFLRTKMDILVMENYLLKRI